MLALALACTAAPETPPRSITHPITAAPGAPGALPLAHDPVVTSEVAPVLGPFVREDGIPAAPEGFDLAAELFADDHVPEFEIDLSDDAIDALRDDPYTWVEGALEYAGARFEPVGVRLKGQRSFLPIDEKPSFKVKLNQYVEGLDLLGLEELTFDNMSTDTSMMAERVSYWLFRQHGLPASRANHALVRISGEDRGLYTLVETVDEEFLELRYADPTGTMWELADVDFVGADIEDFELESGDEDREALEEIADGLLSPDAYDALEPWVDWDEFVAFTAAAAVVGQFDSYPWRTPGDDAHVYFDPADGLMEFLPHGMDETFSWWAHGVFDGPGLLFAACLAAPDCAEDYVDALWAVQDTAEDVDLLAYAEDVREQIEDLVADDRSRPYSDREVEDGQDEMLEFIDDRADQLSALIGAR